METTNQIDIWEYVEIALRRKWLIILPFVLFTFLGVVYSQLPPDIYRASTLILVEPQKVPEAYIQSIVTSTVNERLSTIRQQIMSRTMLERMIDEFDLYRKARESVTMEKLVEKMRKDIELNIQGQNSRQGSLSSFQLFYQGKDPKTVTMVVNKLASLFIEENLRARERQAEGTTEFLDMELNRIRTVLESREEAISDFKELHMGELPGQLDANLRVLDRLQLEVQANGEALRATDDRKVLLQRQLRETDPDSITTVGRGAAAITPSTSPRSQLVELKGNLANLETRYTEKHPEVIRVKKEIKELEARLKKEPGEVTSEGSSSIEILPTNPLYQELRNELAELNLEIERLKAERGRLRREITKYQKRVEKTPDGEQELMILTRDYESIKDNYQSLHDRKLDAQLASNMERRQKGEQFRILDPARIPQTPFTPDRKKIALIGLALGLGIGVGLAFVAEYMDHSFRDFKELEEFTKLPVMASIPEIITEDEKKKAMVKRKIAYASSAGVLIMVIATATVHFLIFRLDSLLPELSHVRKILWP